MEKFIFYVFVNIKNKDQYALTGDQEGSKLPTTTKWSFWKSIEGGLKGRIGFGLEDEKQAREDISNQGYHLYPRKRLLKAGGK